jgi:very-short-patch-repair endonuclease
MPTFQRRETGKARALRNAATPAERELWRHLARSQLDGVKFSRQMPVGPYICDFLSRSARLVIEIDGTSHDTRLAYDASRTEALERAGYRVIRFTNDDVFERIEGVLTIIREALAERPTPGPSRQREGSFVA